MEELILYIGAGIIFLWGIGHIIPTRNIVSGFGNLTPDNKRIITMEWIVEGLTLCFLGVIVAMTVFFFGADNAVAQFVFVSCAAMLFILAGVSIFTGGRTTILPMRLCPYVKTAVGIIYIVPVLF